MAPSYDAVDPTEWYWNEREDKKDLTKYTKYIEEINEHEDNPIQDEKIINENVVSTPYISTFELKFDSKIESSVQSKVQELNHFQQFY